MDTQLTLQTAALGYERRRPPILDNATLAVRAGVLVGVVGPNGSGKSTLVRALSRVLPPLAGAVLLGGRDLYADVNPRQSAQQIGVVPQSASAALEFTVREIVEMGRAPHASPRLFAAAPAADTGLVDEALRAAGIADMAARTAPTLSGGEWQRVLLARALAQSPDVLLLDEPTAHLDLFYQRQVLTLVRALAHDKHKAVLAVLHDLNLASEFCDFLYLVHEGRVVAEGAPTHVLTAAHIQQVYGATVDVQPHPQTGRPLVLSLPDALPPPAFHKGRAVHVLCGMSTGTALLPALRRAGWDVTCSVLWDADPDAAAARRCDAQFPAAAPFAAPAPADWDTDARLALAAAAIIITHVPLGPLNRPALDAAQQAYRVGIPVFTHTPAVGNTPTAEQETAAAVWNSLVGSNAAAVLLLPALLDALHSLPIAPHAAP